MSKETASQSVIQSKQSVVASTAKNDQRIYFLSEVAYDTYSIFNPRAYENFLKFIEQDPDEVMIVVDGALTRLDRPEIMNGLLTFWEKNEKECQKASDLVPNYEQSQKMLEIQMSILDKRLAELRRRLPNVNLVLCVNNDDTQFTVSKMLSELLINRRAQISTAINVMRGEKKVLTVEHRKLAQEFKKDKATSKTRRVKRNKLNQQIRDLKQAEADIVESQEELSLFREQKIRPTHQFVTASVVERLGQMFKEVCREYKVKYIDHPHVLRFGKAADDFAVKYTHSSHKAWAPVRAMDQAKVKSVLANQRQYNELIRKVADDAELDRVDAHVESGHHGIGFGTLQKLRHHNNESNFKGNSSYDPKIAEQKDYVKIVLVTPFEDQVRIQRYLDNKEQVRMGFGKPGGSRNHAVFDRFANGSVSGMTMLTKSAEDGLIWTRWIQYQDFLDGSVLKQPERYWSTWATSDEHIGGQGENPTVRDGVMALYKANAVKPFSYHGRPVHLYGRLFGGDTIETMPLRWDRRYDDRRDPKSLLKEDIEKLFELNQGDPEEVYSLAKKMVSDTMGSNPGSMRVVEEWLLKYFWDYLEVTLQASPAKWPHISVPGNHGDGELQKMGLRETDGFVTHAKAKGVQVYEVGISDHDKAPPMTGVRAGVGGFGDARILRVPDYGLDGDDKPLSGPSVVLIQHDPVGNGTSGLVGAARQHSADNAFAGHTHENWTKLFRISLNQFRVAHRLSTLQGVTMTEVKYAGLPRTQAAHCLIIVKPGDYIEKTIPAAFLREIGHKANLRMTEAKGVEVRKNRKQ